MGTFGGVLRWCCCAGCVSIVSYFPTIMQVVILLDYLVEYSSDLGGVLHTIPNAQANNTAPK